MIEVWNFDIDTVRYRRNVDVEVQNFDIVVYRYRRFHDIDKCSFDICIRYQSFCASRSNFMFFDIGVFFVGSSLGCQLGTGHRLQSRCAHCIANQSSPVAHAPPGPPSAAASKAALGGAAAPAEPGTAQDAAAGAGLSRRSGAQLPERLQQQPERAITEHRSA
jgi:hypothetical protein